MADDYVPPAIPGQFGSDSLTNPSGSTDFGDYDSGWIAMDTLIGNAPIPEIQWLANGGITDASQLSALSGSVNDKPKDPEKSMVDSTTDFVKDFLKDKEGKKLAGMAVLMGLSNMSNQKYKDAQMKQNQQIADATTSRELRAKDNAASAGQAFGLIQQPKTSFSPKPITPMTQRMGG